MSTGMFIYNQAVFWIGIAGLAYLTYRAVKAINRPD